MVGRHRDDTGIDSIASQLSLLGEINYDDFLDTSVNKENMYVLAHRPGLGKTYNILNFLKERIKKDESFSFFYFTDRHSSINEHTRNWKDNEFVHWKGFEEICGQSLQNKSLYKYHISPSLICQRCGKCQNYISQFDKSSRVFAPFQFLNSTHFKDKVPNIIVLDENLKQFTSYQRDFEKAEKLFQMLGRDDLVQFVKDENIAKLKHFDIRDDYQKLILNLIKEKGKNRHELKFLEGFNYYNFQQYIKWESIYNYCLPSYAVPSLYYDAFEASTRGIPLVFLDATFNVYWFRYLLECYNGESKYLQKKGFSNLVTSIFEDEKDESRKKSILYRMHPEENLSKSSFVDKKYWEHTKEWLEVEIKFLKEIYGNNNIGIITLKDLGKYSKAFGYNVEYYNNLRGTNTLKDKLILILLGSFLPIVASWDARKEENKKEKYFDYLLSEYFFLKVDKNNLESIGIQAPKSIVEMYDYSLGKTYSYMYTGDAGKMLGTDGDEIAKKPAEALVTLLWYDEIYQAFHRNRPLNQPRIVFSYCWFPEPNALIYSVDKKKISNNIIGELSLFNHDLRDDFGDIEKVKGRSNELKEFFDKLRTLKYGKGGIIEDIVTEILQNPEITSKILTKKWHVNKPEGGEDTKTITELISAIRKLQNEAKRVEAK